MRAVVLDAIRRGNVFSSIDALGGPVALSFTASGADGSVTMGEDLVDRKGQTRLAVRSNAPEGATVSLLRNGSAVTTVAGPHLEHVASEPGVYRVEIQWPGAPGEPPVPWVVSNPIYVLSGARPAETIAPPAEPKQVATRYANGPANGLACREQSSDRAAHSTWCPPSAVRNCCFDTRLAAPRTRGRSSPSVCRRAKGWPTTTG